MAALNYNVKKTKRKRDHIPFKCEVCHASMFLAGIQNTATKLCHFD